MWTATPAGTQLGRHSLDGELVFEDRDCLTFVLIRGLVCKERLFVVALSEDLGSTNVIKLKSIWLWPFY